MMRHLLDVASLTEKQVQTIFLNALRYQQFTKQPPKYKDCPKIISTMFFEPSTRTLMSFQSAAYRLGANILQYEHATSSAKKGETIEDTITTMSQYSDALIIRHPQEGIMQHLSKYSKVPIINAGDGKGEHPTQALLDVFTILPYINRIINTQQKIVITFVGDLKNGRTVHSTLALLDKLYNNIEFYFVQDGNLILDEWYTMNLRNPFYEKPSIESIIGITDVLYMTRIQKERITDLNTLQIVGKKQILTKSLLEQSKPNTIVLHPLPRTDELPTELDNDPKCKFVEQMKNGVFVRMAILDYLLSDT